MRALSWFAITPVALMAAYWAAPTLEGSFTGHDPAVVAVAPVNLPDVAEKPAPKAVNTAARDIHLAAFGVIVPNAVKIIPRSKQASEVFALQSILMAGKSGSAVVDGKLVRPGDWVGGYYRIAKIEPRTVWLSIKRVHQVKTVLRGKGGKPGAEVTKDVVKEELEPLRFPEYRDEPTAQVMPADMTLRMPAAPGQPTGQSDLEKNYKQILEMLKL